MMSSAPSGRCPLCPGNHKCVKPRGPYTPGGIEGIGEAPGWDEERKDEPFCLESSTRVLKLDLTWVPIGSLEVGDELLGFDENPLASTGSRRWRSSTVTQIHHEPASLCKILRTEYCTLTITGDHSVLTYKGRLGKKRWLNVDDLLIGQDHQSTLVYLFPPWESRQDYNSGWIAGFFDGEGHLMKKSNSKGSNYAGFAQNSGPVCTEAILRLNRSGFYTFLHGEQRTNGVTCEHHYIRGGFKETLQFIGQIRPNRLLCNLQNRLRYGGPEFRTICSRVISRHDGGWHPTTDITTTTGTFIAEGLAVHNCGKTGIETKGHYIPLTGLKWDQLRITNAIRCLPPGPKGKLDAKKQPHLDLLDSCASHFLYPELEALKPRLIIPMGAFACRAIDSSIELDMDHGKPRQTAWGTAFPMWHPAGGIHEPKRCSRSGLTGACYVSSSLGSCPFQLMNMQDGSNMKRSLVVITSMPYCAGVMITSWDATRRQRGEESLSA